MPLGLLDRRGTCARSSACRSRRSSYSRGRRQPPGLAAALGARRRGPLPAAGRADRGRPGAAPAGPRRHVPAARLLPDRDERALLASTCPWYLHDDARDRAAAHPGRRLPAASARTTSPSTSRPATALAAGEPLRARRRARPSTRRRSSTAWSPARSARIHANVANPGLITNLPAGPRVEVPCLRRRRWACTPMHVGDLPPQCAALNRASSAVGELTVRAALEGDPRLVRQAAMVDPNTAATLTRRRDLGAVRRPDRGARRPAAGGAPGRRQGLAGQERAAAPGGSPREPVLVHRPRRAGSRCR